jgi:hypothetical protein
MLIDKKEIFKKYLTLSSFYNCDTCTEAYFSGKIEWCCRKHKQVHSREVAWRIKRDFSDLSDYNPNFFEFKKDDLRIKTDLRKKRVESVFRGRMRNYIALRFLVQESRRSGKSWKLRKKAHSYLLERDEGTIW